MTESPHKTLGIAAGPRKGRLIGGGVYTDIRPVATPLVGD